MNLRDIERSEMTEDAKTIIQKSNQSSTEQMMLSKVKELTEVLENSRSQLRDEKEEKEECLQELETEKKRNSILSSQNTELKKMLEEGQSKHQYETLKLQKELQRVLQQNDDLRNENGLKTREEIESILKKDRELEGTIARKDKLIDTSVVEAVERAESAEKFAKVACDFFREGARERVREIEKEFEKKFVKATRGKEDAINFAKKWMDIAENSERFFKKVELILFGILGLFIILESLFHRGFWKDLFDFFYVPGRWAVNQWISIASDGRNAISFLPVFGRIGITLTFLGALAFFVWMIILTVKRACTYTLTMTTVDLGIAVILGDFFPFNRIIPVFAVMAIYHLVFWIIGRREQRSVSKK